MGCGLERHDLDAILSLYAPAIAYRWHDGTPVCELHEYDQEGLISRVPASCRELAW